MTIEDRGIEGRRRKAPNADFVLRSAARVMVGPIQRKLGPWQARAVHLVAIGQRIRARGHLAPSYAAEAEALSEAVAHEQRWLEEQMEQAPEDVVSHGELADAQRALNSVAEMLVEARMLLGGQTPRLTPRH